MIYTLVQCKSGPEKHGDFLKPLFFLSLSQEISAATRSATSCLHAGNTHLSAHEKVLSFQVLPLLLHCSWTRKLPGHFWRSLKCFTYCMGNVSAHWPQKLLQTWKEQKFQHRQHSTAQYNKTWRNSSAELHVQLATNPATTESWLTKRGLMQRGINWSFSLTQ